MLNLFVALDPIAIRAEQLIAVAIRANDLRVSVARSVSMWICSTVAVRVIDLERAPIIESAAHAAPPEIFDDLPSDTPLAAQLPHRRLRRIQTLPLLNLGNVALSESKANLARR